jgi:hypothetical protein
VDRRQPFQSSGSWFRPDSDPVVHRGRDPLRATEVTLCGLHGDVTKKKLNLLQLAAGGAAEASATLPDMPNAACSALCRMPDYAESHHVSSENRLV